MNQINQQVVDNQRSRTKEIKAYVIFMTCLTVSLILMMFKIVGIRRFEFIHYAFVVFIIGSNLLVWTLWPKSGR